MFNSPLDYCPVCREYVALDATHDECMARHRCRGEDCPLSRFLVDQPAGAQGQPLSPEAGALLGTIARSGQTAFCEGDLERHLPLRETRVRIIEELERRGLLRVAYATAEECGYELTAQGRRHIAQTPAPRPLPTPPPS
jgi:hypothetical protein